MNWRIGIALLVFVPAIMFAQGFTRSAAFRGAAAFRPAVASTVFVTGQSLTSTRNNFTGTVGFKFTANQNFTITDIGRWVVSGNNQTHALTIKDSSCVTLGTVTVDCSGASVGFLYGHLSSPISITSGSVYYVNSAEANGGDFWYDDDTTVTTTSAATVNNSANGCGVNAGAGHSYVPVSFKYQ